MKTLEECNTPYEYSKYAVNNKLTTGEIQYCLDKQEDEWDHYRFAKHVPNLTPEQIQQCLDKMEDAEDHRWFAEEVDNLTNEHIQQCLDKQITSDDYLWFAEIVPNLTTDHIQQCLDKQQTSEEHYRFAKDVPNLTEKQKQICVRLSKKDERKVEVKIFESKYCKTLSDDINAYIYDKDVKDINHRSFIDSIGNIMYTVMVTTYV